jgi:hypothetical protein
MRDESDRAPLRNGKIRFGDLAIDCRILSSSERGAALIVDAGAVLPDQFSVEDLDLDSLHVAKLVWRCGEHVRVHFADVPEPRALNLSGPPVPDRRQPTQTPRSDSFDEVT